MAQNFIILYTSREGSSAIVQHLSRQPTVLVPLLEELDRYWVDKFYPGADICAELDTVFATGRFTRDHDYGRRKFISERQTVVGNESVGFKWRHHGRFRDVLEVLKKHDVMIFVLLRRDLIELTCSSYFKKVGEAKMKKANFGHSQFRFATMDEHEAREFRTELDETLLPMRPVFFFSLMGWRVWRAFCNKSIAWRAARAGLRAETIFYEDFSAAPEDFVSGLMTSIGLEYDPDASQEFRNSFRKTSHKPARQRIRHMWIVDYNPLTYALKALYNGIGRWTF